MRRPRPSLLFIGALLFLALPLHAGAGDDAALIVEDCLVYAQELVGRDPGIPEDEYLSLVDGRLSGNLEKIVEACGSEYGKIVFSEIRGMAEGMFRELSAIRSSAQEEKPAPEIPLKKEPVREPEPEKEVPVPEKEPDEEAVEEVKAGKKSGYNPRKSHFDIGAILGTTTGLHLGYLGPNWEIGLEAGYGIGTDTMNISVESGYVFHFGDKHLLKLSFVSHFRMDPFTEPNADPHPGYGPYYPYYPDDPYQTEEEFPLWIYLGTRIGYEYVFSDIGLVLGGYLAMLTDLMNTESDSVPTADIGVVVVYRF